MSLNGTVQTFIPYTLNGINTLATPNDISSCVKYNGNTSDTNLDGYDLGTTGTLSAQFHAIPDTLSNSESWATYAISTNGNLSTAGGLITQDLTNGRLMYFTGGVLGAPNFQFTTLGTSGKVVVTDGNSVMSTTISAGQLDYITALTSQAGGVGQNNTWTGTNDFQTLTSVAALRITSSVINADYTLSVNSSDQLEFTNLSNGSILKTNGSDLFVSGDITCASLGATDVAASGSFYLAKASPAEWRTMLGMSDEYEIQDDAGVMRLRLSKMTGLTVSTMNITQVPSATPSLALGLNGGGSVVSFAVPTATNILPLANTFTNTNTFLSTLTAGVGYTTSINGALSTSLVDLGFTSASFTTAGITGAYTPPLGTITNPSGSTYQITQTAQGRSIMAISGFTPSVGITYVFSFNMNCTIGTATISVEQDNILVSPALYPLSTGFNRVVGSFTYNGTPNTVVFKIYTGVASWNAQWDSFTLSTYSIGMNADMNALTVSNRFTQRYNALAGDVSTLVNRATMDSAISAAATPNLLPLNNTWSGTNTFNNTVQVSGVGVNLGVSLGSIIKTTATAGSLVQITGGGAGNSPYLEFLFGGNSRGYIGNASAVDLDLVAQNGAKLNFYTAGAKRLEIDTAGAVIMPLEFRKVGGNSGTNWFSIRGQDASNSPYIEFWVASVRRCYIGFATTTSMSIMAESGAKLQMGAGGVIAETIDTNGYIGVGTVSPSYKLHVAGADGNIRAEGSVYCDRYLGTNSALRIDLDAGQTVNWITNNSGTKPITFGPGSWANGGYTVISQNQSVNGVGLGLGNSAYPGNNGGRSVIIGLNPGIAWGEMILSAGIIYTSINGTPNLYTNGGGWVFISDKRCKKDIKDIKTARSLERIMALKPKTYKKIYPENPETPISQKALDAVHIGFLAQDVMETNPHCIDEWVDDNCVCDGDDGKRLGISYGDINVHMVGAIQELKKQNDAQQKQIDDLQEMVRQLMVRVEKA